MKSHFNKRQFISRVKKVLPDNFSNFDTCFYLEPLGHIFSGVVADKIRSEINIHKFIFPLFEGFDENKNVHLDYSEDLENTESFLFLHDFEDNKAVADEFLSKAKSTIDSANNYLELAQFYDYLQTKKTVLRYQKVTNQATLGYTQILLGNADKALSHLTDAIGSKDSYKYPEIWQWKRMQELVSDGKLGKAQEILLNNEKELKQNLGITPKAP